MLYRDEVHVSRRNFKMACVSKQKKHNVWTNFHYTLVIYSSFNYFQYTLVIFFISLLIFILLNDVICLSASLFPLYSSFVHPPNYFHNTHPYHLLSAYLFLLHTFVVSTYFHHTLISLSAYLFLLDSLLSFVD